MNVVTLEDMQRRVLASPEQSAFVEDGMLVLRVRSAVWWVEVYSPVGVPPRVDAEMAPYRRIFDAVAAHRELSIWALGGA